MMGRKPGTPHHSKTERATGTCARKSERRALLFGGCDDEHVHRPAFGNVVKYDPDFHPADVLAYFKGQYDQIEDSERYRTENGLVGYAVRPIRLPTQTRYATMVGVTVETLWAWAKKYPDFGRAMSMAKSYQVSFLIEQGTTGALNAGVTNFTLKNLHGWTERVEETHKGAVALQFDKQDDDA